MDSMSVNNFKKTTDYDSLFFFNFSELSIKVCIVNKWVKKNKNWVYNSVKSFCKSFLTSWLKKLDF